MKTYRLTLGAMAAIAAVTAVCTLAATPALAQASAVMTGEDSGSFHLSRQPFHSRPRAEVVAELKAYRDSGEMDAQIAEELALMFYASRVPPSTLTRAEVHAEVVSARALGELGAMSGEDSGSFFLAQRGGAYAATQIAKERDERTQHVSQLCANPDARSGNAPVRLAQLTR